MSEDRENKFLQTLNLNQRLGFTVSDDTSFALSIFYGIFIINLAIVCIVSQYIASVGPLDISEYYLNFLFFIAVVWFLGFAVSAKWGKNKNDVKQPIKSHHASNRWLKGVVAIFGFSIIIKNALELFAITKVNPECEHKFLHILKPVLHSPFVFGQVTFLFMFAKHHLQQWRHFARFGIIHIMATNFSVWLQTVAEEATEALSFEKTLNEKNFETTDINSTLSDKRETEIEDFTIGDLFRGNCTCTDVYCKRVAQADTFLFPFMIEFCLIATCLLYVTWKKVGKKPKPIHEIFRPCYKFYQAYKGPTCGALVLATTVTVIVLLGASDRPSPDDTYLNKSETLHLYEGFLTCFEFLNMIACLAGFHLYSRSNKERTPNYGLDLVLLFVCFIGPLVAGLFSILSLSIDNDKKKATGWEISLLYPIIDIVGTVIQILFIAYGMQHAPTPASPVSAFKLCEDESDTNEKVDKDFFQTSTQIQSKDKIELEVFTSDERSENFHQLHSVNHNGVDNRKKLLSSTFSDASSKCTSGYKNNEIEQLHQALPDRTRTALREILMFLLISNASLWVFLSLDKTVFLTLTYQYEYFGHGVWNTITAVTNPLSIFLRMHSAACFFEMWAYA